jgi:very-short-patch-repair endonuclease
VKAKPRCTVCGKEPPAVVIDPNRKNRTGFANLCRSCLTKHRERIAERAGAPATPLSPLEEALALQIKAWGLPQPVREHKGVPGRQYRIDFAWPDWMIALEVEGGIWKVGGHSSGTGITRDCEKHSLLALAGWRLLRVTGEHIQDGRAIAWIQEALGCEAPSSLKAEVVEVAA